MNTLSNKNLYKIFLSIIKYVPNFLALAKIIGLILSYNGISSFFLTCLCGTSVTLLVILYLVSIIFRFCGLYRMSLNYVTAITLITTVDWYFTIPVSDAGLYSIYAIVTGIFITTWIVYWYTHRNNPKVDHIKRLCDNYVDCNC